MAGKKHWIFASPVLSQFYVKQYTIVWQNKAYILSTNLIIMVSCDITYHLAHKYKPFCDFRILMENKVICSAFGQFVEEYFQNHTQILEDWSPLTACTCTYCIRWLCIISGRWIRSMKSLTCCEPLWDIMIMIFWLLTIVGQPFL